MPAPEKPTFPEIPPWRPLAYFVAMLALFMLLRIILSGAGIEEISYSDFKRRIAAGQVAEVTMQENRISGRLREERPIGPDGGKTDRFTTRVPAMGDSTLLPALEDADVQVNVQSAQGWGLLIYWLPWLLLLGFFFLAFWRASRLVGGGLGSGGELRRFLQSVVRTAERPQTTFADVAGQESAKRDVQELVAYLRDPGKFERLGAQMPRGVLLMGPPGTGKTLLARALAGEAGVPFFSISGSEFIEVFVGVGASRVRNLFAAAKKQAPSIVFIDELDAVGRTRGTGLGGGHDEREQTLNQILAEMDGFAPHEAVIVLAATNRPDVLDPALLRPGRFDRHVVLDLPDSKDREAILAVHSRKVPLGADVKLGEIAAATPGFSGADLHNLVNEAAILAAREEQERVGHRHFEEARDKVVLGSTRTLAIQPDERHRLAVHEAGHAVVAYFLPHADPLYKVSIVPRGRALGGTLQLPEHERHTLPEDYLRDRLAVMLAGRTAERLLLGTVSSGADDDIRQATALARSMVACWGMSEAVGPVDLRDSEEHPFLGREIAQPRRFSESSAQAVDEGVRTLLKEAEQRIGEALRQHAAALGRLVEALEREEDIDRARIEALLGRRTSPAIKRGAQKAH
ncbi:ATP-dependent zinc metalloprotease FtsH [Aromatoleum bremense]|uniref:ATP-dependent zinc metalloprotease FtsH n=1 Tax=Aromatoleum bremense TaxID=76115 RepID=A0ABX1NQC8_9RHOO|nr:ATP-dependent zinc metalloprotease FtsH [Aromatoleum bremense]NMG14169.1 ATP-dependent zinc metalloprotease FtsH [Aromatoleum bremense]QTQ33949.1 ATP-dependent zinc metalloprotease [Aromatoleum bremense]